MERQIKYTPLPELDKGEIWATQRDGVFVVVASEAARWRGEDRDVYAHIDTWYTVRDATVEESALWSAAVAASDERRAQRKRLGAEGYTFNHERRQLAPSGAAMRRLDSYDDRWVPPKPIDLNDDEVAIEVANDTARAALKGH